MTWPFPAADSDARHIDRATDDLAVDDPYATTWEPVLGSVHVAVIAATQASARSAGSPAGSPADARATDASSSPSRGVAATSELPQKGTRQ